MLLETPGYWPLLWALVATVSNEVLRGDYYEASQENLPLDWILDEAEGGLAQELQECGLTSPEQELLDLAEDVKSCGLQMCRVCQGLGHSGDQQLKQGGAK
jgi:hypothetical protein